MVMYSSASNMVEFLEGSVKPLREQLTAKAATSFPGRKRRESLGTRLQKPSAKIKTFAFA